MRAIQHFEAAPTDLRGMRPDERGVRLLFVEHSPEYATLVCETLDASSRGHFEVRHAPRLDAAVENLALSEYDALLLDFTTRGGPAVESIESASRLASRLPVILLTGSDAEPPGQDTPAPVEEAVVRERMARSRLPNAILRAVRRHRRLGQQSATEPIVLRDPLRALATAFARLRRA